jgi:hypothetical protein
VLLVIVAMCIAAVILYLYARVGLGYILATDPQAGDIGAWRAIKTSWGWTRGRGVTLVGITLVIVLLMVVSAACLLLPLIFFAMPLAMAVSASVYMQLGVSAGVFPRRHTCPTCFYDLRGIDAQTCPECGNIIPDEVRRAAPS